MREKLKKILMIATGGTIACVIDQTGLTPAMNAEQILSYVPAIKNLCAVDAIQLFNIDSTNIRPEHWLKMAETIRSHYDEYDGFVILHGTDTMAYTASVLSYLIQNNKKPIVITGAQKPINTEVTDAKTNLYDSFLYCASNYASGVQIVFDGKVIEGTSAKKTHSKSYNAFSSINYPYLAIIQDGKIMQYIKGNEKGEPRFFDRLDQKVGLFKLIPGANAEILDYYFSKNDAVIIESFGTGGIPDGEGYGFYEVLDKWRKKGKIIVMCTQVVNEGSDMTVYKVGKRFKEKFGFLESYDMTPESVVAKLMWILSFEKRADEVKKLFYKTINNDILYFE
ncbi:MAG: asparaginase [Clostridia bacterium]|nr:asparaginase [Clostridia bacterium]